MGINIGGDNEGGIVNTDGSNNTIDASKTEKQKEDDGVKLFKIILKWIKKFIPGA